MKVLIIVCAVILLILFINLDGCLTFECTNAKSDVTLHIKIGFIRIFIPIAGKKTQKEAENGAEAGEEPRPEKKHKKKSGAPEQSGGAWEQICFFRRVYHEVKDDFFGILSYLARRGIDIRRLEVCMRLGTGDAAYTGVLYGLASGLLYNLLAIMHNKTRIRQWKIDAVPDFDNAVFYVKTDCIVRTRLAHIMVIGIKGLKILFRYRKLTKISAA